METEKIISQLLLALHESQRLLAERVLGLCQSPEWSEVTEALAPSNLGFFGYVDGELTGLGGVAWAFDLVRDGHGWIVERRLNLNRNTTDYQETVTELPDVRYVRSSDLAEDLLTLVAELLALPPPRPTTPAS